MGKTELMKELEKKFAAMQKELGFKSSFEDIDNIFFIKDSILSAGFVSDKLSRQVCSRIVDTYMSWTSYLHNLVLPNPQNMININESKMFDEREKKSIIELVTQITELTSRHTLIGITKDKKEEAKFIDNAVNFWNNTFKPKLTEVMKKVNSGWAKK